MTTEIEVGLASDERVNHDGAGCWFEDGASRIYYEEYGSGDPVLLMPGFSERGEDQMMIRDALVNANYRVIAADLPGSGRSQPQPRRYAASYLGDDARSFSALLQHLEIEKAHLVGFSDGGEVALLMAALTPALARSVVSWGAAGQFSDPSGQLRQAMYTLIDDPIPPLQDYREFLIATYGKANARSMTQSFAEAVGQIIDKGGDISFSLAGNIACPVLLIAGEHDMFVPEEILVQMAARIANVQTHYVKYAGHDVHNAQPEWFAQTVLAWLKMH